MCKLLAGLERADRGLGLDRHGVGRKVHYTTRG